MDTFSIIRNSLDASEDITDKDGLDAHVIMYGRVTEAVQRVVDALTPPDGGRYIISFANVSTAGTNLEGRRIIVSARPMRDPRLNLVERAVVIATFAAHEIGHTLITRPRKAVVDAHNTHSGFHTVVNLADDIVLEPWMVDRYPILADAFEFTGGWVLRNGGINLPLVCKMTRKMTTPDRYNVLLRATRYGDIDDIVFDGDAAKIERDWARDWAERLIASPVTNVPAYLAMVDEAWERIRTEPDVEDEPEDEPEPTPTDDGGTPGQGDDQGEGEPNEDEDGGEPNESDEGGGQPGPAGDDPDGDPGEQPSADQLDWDDDDEATDDEATDDGDCDNGEPNDDGGVNAGQDGDDLDGEGNDDEDGGDNEPAGQEEFNDGDQGTDPDNQPGGGDAEADAEKAKRAEEDFSQDEVDKTTHEQSESPAGDNNSAIEEAVRKYSSTTVTAFGIHGHLSTEWT